MAPAPPLPKSKRDIEQWQRPTPRNPSPSNPPRAKKKKLHKDATADLYAQHAPKTPDDAMRAIWHKPSEIRRHERELFKRFASDVKPRETMGLAPKHAPLANCYGWTQSRDFVIVVVWLQGSSDDVTVEINDNRMLVQTEAILR